MSIITKCTKYYSITEMVKKSVDILFQEANKILENNGCYTFKDMDYDFFNAA